MEGTLVLDKSYRPIDVIDPIDAVLKVYFNKAVVVLDYEDKFVNTPSISFRVPKVIALYRLVPIKKTNSRVSKKYIKARDNYTCVYCETHEANLGKGNALTVDHVKPKSKFNGTEQERKKKATTWDNCVTSCFKCNNKKGDRLPHECNMYPTRGGKPYSPHRPSMVAIRVVDNMSKFDREQLQFVEPWYKHKK